MRRAVVIERRPMTADEIALARACSPAHITYVPGTGTKSFAAAMALQADQPAPLISEGQAVSLRAVAYRFRRQLPADALDTLERIRAAHVAAVTLPSDTAEVSA